MIHTLAQMNFHALDWLIVAVYLALIMAAGYYTNRFTGSVGNYLVAGRQVRKGLLIATFIGTELGLVSIAAFAQLGFTAGLAGFHIGVLGMAVCVIVGLTGFVVYRLRETGVMTIPEYYEQRFGPRTRVLGGIILVTMGILNMGQFLKAGALFIGGLTGLGEVGGGVDLYIKLIMTALLVIVFLYVILGGVISVVVTDYLQFTVLGVGFVIITLFCFNDVGWQGAVEAVARHKVEAGATAESGFDPTSGDGMGWVYIIWMLLVVFSLVALWQPVTIRALIAESPKVAKQTYLWSGIGYLVRLVFPAFWGTCALAFFMNQPELYEAIYSGANPADNTLMATAAYLGQLLPVGLLGLIAAGMLAAFMSTHDSYLLAWSSSLVQDVIAPLRGGEVSDKARILMTRIFIFLIGCFLLFWGLWYDGGMRLWNYMAMTGTIFAAGAFPVVVGGLYWRRASSTGAVLAMLMGLIGLLGMFPWSPEMIENWPILEVKNLSLTIFGLGAAAMIVGSLLFPDRRDHTTTTAQEVNHATAG